MYSYDDKIRAVELYIKLGKRLRATIRHLGFPTKNALKGWYRQYERRGDLARGFHRRPKYSMEQQRAAVDHFLHHGRCIEFTRKALRLSVPVCHLREAGFTSDVEISVSALSDAVAQCQGHRR